MKHLSTPHNFVEHDLILSLKSSGINKARAEEKLFVNYSYLVVTGMRNYRLQEDDAFSAYSDSILDVINAIATATFQERSSLKTYICRVFYNKCIDIIRKKTARKNGVYETVTLDIIESSLCDETMNVAERLDEDSAIIDLKQKINRLGTNHSKLLFLSMIGYTDREIATMINLKSMAVVKVTRLRCIKKLRCMPN